MSPLRKTDDPRGAALRSVLLAVLLSAAAFAAGRALVAALRDRQALAVVFPRGAPWLLAATAGATLLAGLALLRQVAVLRSGRPPSTSWRPFRVLVYALFLSSVLFVVAFQPWREPVFVAWLGITAGAWAGLVLVADPLAARLPRRLRAALNIVLLNLTVLAIAGELGLAAWAAEGTSPLLAADDSAAEAVATWRLRPENRQPGFPVNATGHFDDVDFVPKAPGTRLVVTIGDSFSASTVPHLFHFTTVAERKLGAPIANMGMPAIGPREYEWLLRNEALPLDPDVVVVDLFVGNDLTAPLADPAGPGFPRSWLDADRLLLARGARRWLALRDAGPDPSRRVPGALHAEDGPPAGVAVRSADAAELLRLFPWLADAQREVPYMADANYLRLAQRHALEICSDRPLPWPAVFASIERMRAACGAKVRFAVMLIPDELQVEDAVWKQVVDSLPGERLERDQPQRVLDAWLSEQGIPSLDLLPALRAIPPMADGRRHLYHRNETHFNARGNQAAGEALAEFLAGLMD